MNAQLTQSQKTFVSHGRAKPSFPCLKVLNERSTVHVITVEVSAIRRAWWTAWKIIISCECWCNECTLVPTIIELQKNDTKYADWVFAPRNLGVRPLGSWGTLWGC